MGRPADTCCQEQPAGLRCDQTGMRIDPHGCSAQPTILAQPGLGSTALTLSALLRTTH